eukprot:5639409-Pyramimonas_sp.AAC.1
MNSEDLPSDGTQHAVGSINVALLLGRRHRGESVKTGQEQGVVIDSGLLSHILAERVRQIEPTDKSFQRHSCQSYFSLERCSIEVRT